MTPAEMYDYDLKGYLLLEDAIQPNDLASLQERMAFWEAQARKELEKNPRPENPSVMVSDIVNKDPAFVDLITNPEVLPYIDAMVDHPRLKSTWIAYKWKGGWARDRSNHTPTRTTNFYHFNGGRIYHNLFQVFYALRDIEPGEGGLKLIPGSHKANLPLPDDTYLGHMEVEIPMKAGSVLLFSHDMYHSSLNTSDKVRWAVIFTYCPSVITNSYSGDGLYDKLFEKALERSWLKYLLRRPHGFKETYPRPEGRAYTEG